ncbi:hypothetical protein KR222_004645 [Zaprionus bogoriensis]|nr:hypothetical protein KR222_004645 [Zaprionus bogoriensis]
MHRFIGFLVALTLMLRIDKVAWAQRRSMIYPELAPTPVTFLCAIGIPVEDLPFETVVSGYALRLQYFLPNNASQVTRIYFKPQPISDRRYRGHSKMQSKLNLASIYRWIIYRGIEMILQKKGLPGHSCLLRVICEHASLPLTHESGLLGELLHIVLTPSSSRDALGMSKDQAYLSAERFGRRGGSCEAAYGHRCKRSALDMITVLLTL